MESAGLGDGDCAVDNETLVLVVGGPLNSHLCCSIQLNSSDRNPEELNVFLAVIDCPAHS